jgi:hypothetical protein
MPSEGVTRYFIVIEAVVVVVTLFAGFLSYIKQEAEQAARGDVGKACCQKRLMGYFVAKHPRRLAYFLAKLLSGLIEFSSLGITRIPEVPTIASLIQAGDNLVYTSSMFDHIPPSPQEVCWVSLYTQFFNEMAWLEKSQTSEARVQNEFVKRFLSQADKYVDKLQKDFEKVGCDTPPQAPMNGLSQSPTDDLESGRDIQVSMSSDSIQGADKAARATKRINGLSTSTTSLPKPPRSIATIWAILKDIVLLRKPPKSHSDRRFPYQKKCVAMVCCVRDLSESSSPPPPERSQVLRAVQYCLGGVEKACRDIGDAAETVVNPHRQPRTQNSQTTTGNGEENTSTQEKIEPSGGSNKILHLPHIRPLWIVNSIPCIETSREELAGLALVMGINLVKGNEDSVSGIGPFGMHLNAKCNFLDWGLRLTYQHRQPDHEASKGSGYSTLFAKHMACNSLPFKLSKDCVHYIYVDSSLLKIIGAGQTDQPDQPAQTNQPAQTDQPAQTNQPDRSTQTDQPVQLSASDHVPDLTLKYLYRLPTAHHEFAAYGVQDRADKYLYPLPTAHEFAAHEFAAHGVQDGADKSWFEAVAGIAFGGLVPQAGEKLTRAILFTVIGESDPDKDCSYCHPIIKALQNLVDTLHDDCPELNLFGNYVAKRPRNGLGISEADHSIKPTSRHAGALFGRYMTALERLTAKSLSKEGNPKERVEEIYRKCYDLLKDNYENDHKDDLAADVVTVTDKIKRKDPITIEDCGKVARRIIASWAFRVPRITLNWDSHSNDSSHSHSNDSSYGHTPTLQELPAVSAFGL